MKCPKCSHECASSDLECPKCGIIFKNYELYLAKEKSERSEEKSSIDGQIQRDDVRKTDNTIFRPGIVFGAGIALAILGLTLAGYVLLAPKGKSASTTTTTKIVEPINRQGRPLGEEETGAIVHYRGEATRVPTDGVAVAFSSESLTDLVKKIQPAVVTVMAMDANGNVIKLGTGFFVDTRGSLITNHHVLEGASNAAIKCFRGGKYPIKMVLRDDKKADLMEVAAEVPMNVGKKLEMTSEQPDIAEPVVVIGSPYGLDQTVSEGIVSGFREINDRIKLLQISAPISPGSSGSPVVNKHGKVIGIAVGQIPEAQNLNFAIPAMCALRLESEGFRPIPFPEWASQHSPGISNRIYKDESPKQKTLPPEPPIPQYPSVPEKYVGFMTSGYSNREGYEQRVFKEIGGNPFEIDPREEVVKALNDLPQIFDQAFQGQIRWEDRGRMNKDQAAFWNSTVKKFEDYVYNNALSHKQTMMEQYNWKMSEFDNAWKEYQLAIENYQRQMAAHDRWQQMNH